MAKKSRDAQKNNLLSWQVLLVIGVIIAIPLYFGYRWLFGNYAQDTFSPIGTSLARVGAVKQCDAGDTGRGFDNLDPWYKAIYEIPGNPESAAQLVQQAAKQAGYDLQEYTPDISREDHIFYHDENSKVIPYTDLEPGNIKLNVTFYPSEFYISGSCGVQKTDKPTKNVVTAIFTLSLSEYKH